MAEMEEKNDSTKKDKDKNEYENKMETIKKKLREIHEKKESLSPIHYSNTKTCRKPFKPVIKPKRLHHSRLELVVYESLNSPYFIPAPNAYPSRTIHLTEQSQVLRSGNESPLPPKQLQKAKKKFLDEVINWRADWSFPMPKDASAVYKRKSPREGILSPLASNSKMSIGESRKSTGMDQIQENEAVQEEDAPLLSKSLPDRPESCPVPSKSRTSPVRGQPARNRKQIKILTRSRKEQSEISDRLSKPASPPRIRTDDNEEEDSKADKEGIAKARKIQEECIQRLSSPKPIRSEGNDEEIPTAPVVYLQPDVIENNVSRLSPPKYAPLGKGSRSSSESSFLLFEKSLRQRDGQSPSPPSSRGSNRPTTGNDAKREQTFNLTNKDVHPIPELSNSSEEKSSQGGSCTFSQLGVYEDLGGSITVMGEGGVSRQEKTDDFAYDDDFNLESSSVLSVADSHDKEVGLSDVEYKKPASNVESGNNANTSGVPLGTTENAISRVDSTSYEDDYEDDADFC